MIAQWWQFQISRLQVTINSDQEINYMFINCTHVNSIILDTGPDSQG